MMRRTSNGILEKPNFIIRICRFISSQGIFSCTLLFGLFILMSLIAATYVQTGGGPSKSGFGCDFQMSPPHVNNRSVNYAFCEIHRPLHQVNKDLKEKLLSVDLSSSVRFLVVGDFGRDGWCCQRDVAYEMARAAATIEPDFVINVGDAFYEYGLMSTTEEQVYTSWIDIYFIYNEQLKVPWYSVLGNHEYRGSAEAVLELTKEFPKFVMKGRYYEQVLTSKDNSVSVHIFFLDTNPMIAKYRQPYYDDRDSTMLNQPDGIHTQWNKVETQLQWLEEGLNSSTAHVKVVVGHHPVYTSGSHIGEDDGFLRKRIGPILERNNVLAYFSGHDHNLQEYWKVYTTTHYIVSAGGSKVEGSFKERDEYLQWFDQINGFCAVEATSTGLKVTFVDSVGNVIRNIEISPYV